MVLQRPHQIRPFKETPMSRVQIAGEDLQFTPAADPIPEPLTGELIAKLAGADDPKEFIVIQWLKDGESRDPSSRRESPV